MSKHVDQYVITPTGGGRVAIREARYRRPFAYMPRRAAFQWVRNQRARS
jgi:hypothetical protein